MKYEYKQIRSFMPLSDEHITNKYGAFGWDMCGFAYRLSSDENYIYYFKRVIK